MRTTPRGSYNSHDLITSALIIKFWFIDANTLVLAPLIITNASVLKPNLVTVELEPNEAIKAAHTYLLARDAMVIIVLMSYEAEALMRFTASVSYNGWSSKADTLKDTTVSLNCVIKKFDMANGFFKG